MVYRAREGVLTFCFDPGLHSVHCRLRNKFLKKNVTLCLSCFMLKMLAYAQLSFRHSAGWKMPPPGSLGVPDDSVLLYVLWSATSRPFAGHAAAPRSPQGPCPRTLIPGHDRQLQASEDELCVRRTSRWMPLLVSPHAHMAWYFIPD